MNFFRDQGMGTFLRPVKDKSSILLLREHCVYLVRIFLRDDAVDLSNQILFGN